MVGYAGQEHQRNDCPQEVVNGDHGELAVGKPQFLLVDRVERMGEPEAKYNMIRAPAAPTNPTAVLASIGTPDSFGGPFIGCPSDGGAWLLSN